MSDQQKDIAKEVQDAVMLRYVRQVNIVLTEQRDTANTRLAETEANNRLYRDTISSLSKRLEEAAAANAELTRQVNEATSEILSLTMQLEDAKASGAELQKAMQEATSTKQKTKKKA
jgi:chromosome segregation ATPase